MNELAIIAETTEAIANDPTNVEAYRRRALMLFKMGMVTETINDLNALIDTLKVEDAELYRLRGAIRMHLDDKKGAIEDLKKAMALNPDMMKEIEGLFVKE